MTFLHIRSSACCVRKNSATQELLRPGHSGYTDAEVKENYPMGNVPSWALLRYLKGTDKFKVGGKGGQPPSAELM